MNREISPPPLKRRKIEASGDVAENDSPQDSEERQNPDNLEPGPARCLRLFSWNINGTQPFLSAPNASITSFFKPVSRKGDMRTDGALGTKVIESESTSNGRNPLRGFLRRHRWPEILFLQELKISPLDKKTPTALLTIINTSLDREDTPKPHTRYTLDINLPRDKHNARGFGGKLYGVGTLLREDFASQYVADVRHAHWDLEGRVTIIKLRPEQTKVDIHKTQPVANNGQIEPLAILNVYAVNGTTAPYRSPETGSVVGTRHDHKLNFHTRMRDECLGLESRGYVVVIAGDLNIARGGLDGHPKLRTYPRQHSVNRADFNAKFFGDEDNARAEAYITGDGIRKEVEARFDGVDVFRALRGKERRYTYHPRSGDDWGSSCDRVDFIIVSRALFDSKRVIETEILDSPQERGTSDHVPLTVKIRLDKVLYESEDSTSL